MKDKQRIKRRVFVKQRDEKDCGPACLCSICEYYGIHLPLARARELSKSDLQGTNVFGLTKAAEMLGFSVNPASGTYEEFMDAVSSSEVQFPAIAHIITPEHFEHYIVVYRIQGDEYLVLDPSVGRRIMSRDEFLRQWTGIIINLENHTQNQTQFDTVKPSSLLLSLIASNKSLVAWVVSISLVLTAIGIACAFIFQFVIDGVVMKFGFAETGELLSTLTNICIAVVVLYVVQAALTCMRGYCLACFSNRLDTSVMMDFYNRLMSLPMDFFGTRKTGEILSRFSDAAKIRDAVSSVTFTALIDCVMVIAGTILLFSISWQLACVALSLFVAYISVMAIYAKKLEEGNKNLMESNAQLQSYLKESIDGIETIKTFVKEKDTKELAMNKFRSLLRQSLKMNVMVNNQSAIIGFFSSIATIGILWIGVQEILQGTMTLGSLITFNALIGYFLTPLQRVIGLQPEIQSAFVALDRLNDINELSEENIETGVPAAEIANPLHISNIDFRYGNRELVLSDVSIRVSRGEKIALLGESGCGKTTLARLLLSFYDPEQGSISMGGKEIREISKKSLRSKVAYLSQETYLFSGTIAENIKYGNPDVTDEEFKKVCDQCMVSDFVSRMALKYDTLIEERGANLSGGQKQRIALARVLVKKPELIILDEATSNLDSITERAIIKAMDNLGRDTTCIIIAHRLSTIIGCDRIVLMEDGKILEVGNHENLLAKKGKYYTYWINQMGREREDVAARELG